jgi:hypothetical protein
LPAAAPGGRAPRPQRLAIVQGCPGNDLAAGVADAVAEDLAVAVAARQAGVDATALRRTKAVDE